MSECKSAERDGGTVRTRAERRHIRYGSRCHRACQRHALRPRIRRIHARSDTCASAHACIARGHRVGQHVSRGVAHRAVRRLWVERTWTRRRTRRRARLHAHEIRVDPHVGRTDCRSVRDALIRQPRTGSSHVLRNPHVPHQDGCRACLSEARRGRRHRVAEAVSGATDRLLLFGSWSVESDRAYPSLDERESRRAALAEDPAWQAFAPKIQALMEEMENKIMKPARFSPLA
ncbi:hypothetical protein PSAB6_290039 [Paraburkholderia sabiae]|nr:hypothetical protein PSAB6_290039 [Paraburkholderia sabiae]